MITLNLSISTAKDTEKGLAEWIHEEMLVLNPDVGP